MPNHAVRVTIILVIGLSLVASASAQTDPQTDDWAGKISATWNG